MSERNLVDIDIEPRARAPSWHRGGQLLFVAVIAVSVAVIGLVVLLWPLVQTLNRALNANISALAGIVFALLVISAFGLVRIMFAFGRKLDNQAEQAAIVQLPGAVPIIVRQLRQVRPGELIELSGRSFDVAQVAAEHSNAAPHHYAPQITYSQAEALPVPATPALPPPAETSLQSGVSRLQQLHQRGHVGRSGKSLLAGYDANLNPLYIELADCGFMGIGGQPRVGKSTYVKLLISQMILLGWHVFISDPHAHKEDGLLPNLRPLSGVLSPRKQAFTPAEIAAQIRLVDKIGRRRVNGEDKSRTPVVLVIDEFTNLVWRKLLPDDVLAILPSMAVEYAGVHVHGMIISHDYSKASLGGDLGAALRRSFTHRSVLRMDAANAEFLLPPGQTAILKQVPTLEKGQLMYWSPEGPALAAFPKFFDEDMIYAAQGKAPRPYQAWTEVEIAACNKPLLGVKAPDTASPAAQPTQKQLVLRYLTAESPKKFTAAELAAALNIGKSVMLKLVNEMSDDDLIDREGTPRNYQYSVTN